jgi:predicted component of type VI protein secretion system
MIGRQPAGSLDATTLMPRPLATADPEPGWRLRTAQGRGEGALHGLREGLRLGRVADNDIVLGDRDASRHHARIERDGDGFAVVDLGSLNGTRVNGRRIEGRTGLKPGDRIRIASVEFLVEAEPVVEDLAATRLGLDPPLPRREEPPSRTETPVVPMRPLGEPAPVVPAVPLPAVARPRRVPPPVPAGAAEPERPAHVSPPPPPPPPPPPLPPKDASVCPACGRALRQGARFCGGCGKPAAGASAAPRPRRPVAPAPASKPAGRVCPKCAAPLKPGARFCSRCGGPTA